MLSAIYMKVKLQKPLTLELFCGNSSDCTLYIVINEPSRSFHKKDWIFDHHICFFNEDLVSSKLCGILLLAIFSPYKYGTPNIITSLSTCHPQRHPSSVCGSFDQYCSPLCHVVQLTTSRSLCFEIRLASINFSLFE
jgi:hypothetical protein